MKAQEYLLNNSKEFLAFLRTRVPVFHLSNIFFRDVHFSVIAFLEAQGMRVAYTSAERLAYRLIEKLEKEKILGPIDRQTWVVLYPDYRTPNRKPAAAAAPAKPAGPAAATAKPAGPAAATAKPAGPAAPVKPAAASAPTATPAGSPASSAAPV